MSFSLSAKTRTEKGEKVRSKTAIPAVVYGAGSKVESLTLSAADFAKLYQSAGEASLIDLAIDDKANGKVLIHALQYDPVTDAVAHVDLRRIDMTKPMTASVRLVFSGESPVIKEQGGTVVRHLEEAQVRCLPKDLIAQITVDLGALKTFDDVVRVRDLSLPAGVAIINHGPEDLVVKALPALTEEEIKAMEEAAKPADLSAIEMAGKKKEEEAAEGEEGAALEGAAKPAAEAKAEEKKKEEPKK
ncbi:50S ribosomal protein L25 [Patescibacteria group bacterium]|nr:MAG: 50S ribosomal protein L25 [Patescibacteria group bacterium]